MISIKQIYYDQNQEPFIEDGAIPFFNKGRSPAEEREFGVMRTCFQNKELFPMGVNYEGFISWKFSEKARIPLKTFISAVEENPGYDVYILNPFPHQVFYKNVWYNGEAHHPGLLEMAQKLIDKVGVNWTLAQSANIVSNISYCNFWVGNQKFWDLYMGHCLPLYQGIMEDEFLRTQFFKPAPGGNVNAPYFAFFFERIITEVLNHHPEIKVKSFRYPLPWLENNFREDVAKSLNKIPWQTDLNTLSEENKAEFALLLNELKKNEASFYEGRHFGSSLLRLIKRQHPIKEYIRNPVTMYIYRRLIKRFSNKSASASSIRLS